MSTGRAVLAGIHRYKNVNELEGCLRDVEDMTGMLTEVLGFEPNNIRAIVDEKATKPFH